MWSCVTRQKPALIVTSRSWSFLLYYLVQYVVVPETTEDITDFLWGFIWAVGTFTWFTWFLDFSQIPLECCYEIHVLVGEVMQALSAHHLADVILLTFMDRNTADLLLFSPNKSTHAFFVFVFVL